MEEAAVGMFLCLLGAVLFDMETQLSNQLSLQTLGTLCDGPGLRRSNFTFIGQNMRKSRNLSEKFFVSSGVFVVVVNSH